MGLDADPTTRGMAALSLGKALREVLRPGAGADEDEGAMAREKLTEGLKPAKLP